MTKVCIVGRHSAVTICAKDLSAYCVDTVKMSLHCEQSMIASSKIPRNTHRVCFCSLILVCSVPDMTTIIVETEVIDSSISLPICLFIVCRPQIVCVDY